jgi:hypothetical protein
MDNSLTKVTFHSLSNKLSPIHWNTMESETEGWVSLVKNRCKNESPKATW